MNYHDYLKSPVWLEKRKTALVAADHKCQTCNSPLKLNVHHRKYPKALGTESLHDLVVLCEKCHKVFHDKRSVGPGKIVLKGRVTATRKKYHYWVRTTDASKVRALCNPGLIYNRDDLFSVDTSTVSCRVCAVQLNKRSQLTP